jgi:hypothetical protein
MQLLHTGNSDRISKWVLSVLMGPGTPKEGVEIALLHAGIDDAQRPVRTWPIGVAPEEDQCRELVEDIDREAAQDAESLGHGMQRYQLRARVQGGREFASLSLKYVPSQLGTEFASFTDSEPPNQKGLIWMLMRHADGNARLTAAGYAQIMDNCTRRLRQQDDLIDRMMENQGKVFQTMRELAEMKLERDVTMDKQRRESELETLRETQKMERSQLLWQHGLDQVVPLVPAILNRLLRKEVVPEKMTPIELALANLVRNLSPEQLEGLSRAFSPEQMVAFLSLADQLTKHKTQAASPTRTSPPDNDEDPAAVIVNTLRTTLNVVIPWAAERLKNGQPIDPSEALPAETVMIKRLMATLTPADYTQLVATTTVFKEEESRIFRQIVQVLGLQPGHPGKPA